jgi:hypothetical protein
VNRLLNKWALLSFAAALVIIGCGGSGGGGSHSSTGTSGSGAPGTNLSITIGKTNAQGQIFGTADFTYLTGQGRAPGDLTAIINYVQLQDQYGVVSQSLGAQATLPLTQFTAQQLELDVPFKGQNSRLFESYTQVFSQFLVSGESTPADPPAALTFPARIRVFPGRDTEIPIFLDDSMFVDTGSDPTNSAADLIAYTYVSPPPSPQTPVNSVFAYRNLNPALATATAPAGEMGSYLGDYVGFDISAMPTAKRPQLVTSNGANGQYATQLCGGCAVDAGWQRGNDSSSYAELVDADLGQLRPDQHDRRPANVRYLRPDRVEPVRPDRRVEDHFALRCLAAVHHGDYRRRPVRVHHLPVQFGQ